MKPQITAINPKQIDTYWGVVSDLMEQAADKSAHYTVNDIYRALKEERAYLWIIHSGPEILAALVTRLELTKDGKTGAVWAMAGDEMDKWAHLIEPLEAWAKAEGCNRMRHIGRPGLVRVMKKFGYRMTHATIEKAI